MSVSEDQPFLSRAEPMLPVNDIVETVNYWRDLLGFRDVWTWGDPVNHGGAVWHDAAIQFYQNPTLATASKGNAIFIRVKNIESLYQFHQTKNIEIAEPLENKPWGMSGYTVREINGYYIVFGGKMINERKKAEPSVSNPVKIVYRIPTADEYLKLIEAVGWGSYQKYPELTEKILKAPVFSAVAEDESTGEVIGCALLLGDNASFYYVKDVMVIPTWQNKKIGSMMMKALSDWLDNNAPENAFVCLFTGENLAEFYKQFDFGPAFGMTRRVKRS
jgi:GNAT superfamily N-acetyltransferase